MDGIIHSARRPAGHPFFESRSADLRQRHGSVIRREGPPHRPIGLPTRPGRSKNPRGVRFRWRSEESCASRPTCPIASSMRPRCSSRLAATTGSAMPTSPSEFGIRKASIHHHFPTKGDLGVRLVERFREECREGFDRIDEMDDPRIRLREYVSLFRATMASGRLCLCGALSAGLISLPGPLRRAVVRGPLGARDVARRPDRVGTVERTFPDRPPGFGPRQCLVRRARRGDPHRAGACRPFSVRRCRGDVDRRDRGGTALNPIASTSRPPGLVESRRRP